MELKYIVLTIIKILVSVPTILLTTNLDVDAASLMGGHLDNGNNTNDFVGITFDSDGNYRRQDSSESFSTEGNQQPSSTEADKSEEIPNPSPLVIPGYNLPENIFNRGKPFYLEKDPLTGQVDFTNKTPVNIDDDFYDYSEESGQSDDIFNKANIDRKDGSIGGSHRPSDINQLSPNFHDFLNLPIKYNPDKYVYPLISNSYANTKVQGNVNKYHNHKSHVTKFPTYKPTNGPYLPASTLYNKYYENDDTSTTTTTTTTTTMPTTSTSTYNNYNLMNSPVNHPSFSEDFSDDYYESSEKEKNDLSFKPTEKINNIYLTTTRPSSTTGKVMSLFEQLFGDYDETVTTTQKTRPPSLFANLPSNKIKNSHQENNKVEEFSTSTKPYSSSHSGLNVATGSNMEMENLYEEEYDDYYYNNQNSSDNAPTNKPSSIGSTTLSTTTTSTTPAPTRSTSAKATTIFNSHSYKESTPLWEGMSSMKHEPKPTTEFPTSKITSLPLGENHVSTPQVTSMPIGDHLPSNSDNYRPIIIATQNLRHQLNNERVVPKPFTLHSQHAPSTSSIHIPPDQDTVSFVVGHHQSMDGGSYAEPEGSYAKPGGSYAKPGGSYAEPEGSYAEPGGSFAKPGGSYAEPEGSYAEPGGSYAKPGVSYAKPGGSNSHNGFNTNSFQPLYGEGSYENDDIIYNNSPDTVIFQQPQLKKHPEASGSVVTIQTQTNSEASLSIGVPVEDVKKPGQVMDAKLELDKVKPELSTKIVFPDEKEVSLTSLIPPPSTSNPPVIVPNREILKLASKPMFHQLPSSLTPPKENESKRPVRLDSPRPPWDPRPGHFFSGKLEYSRPPRPFPDMAYKRIDTLPNILPQFRPNMKSHGPNPHEYKHGVPHGPHRAPPHFYDTRLHREPLLERPSNRPLEFFEKLQPPPLPPKNLHNFRKIPPVMLEQRTAIAQDRKGEEYYKKPSIEANTILYPPKVVTSSKKEGGEVETLQMLQAKQSDKKEMYPEPVNSIVQETNKTEKPVYVVYPVNTAPIKLDVIDANKRESVVIGTRAELPLPPSEISEDFIQDKNSILGIKDRNDSPVLKPQQRPHTFPIKSDFPYPLERPDISVLHPVPDATNNGIGAEDIQNSEAGFVSNNQWNTIDIESRIVNGNKLHNHIYTEKPIAVAYTPTEPQEPDIYDKYSIPHFGSSNVEVDTSHVYHHVPTKEETHHMVDPNPHLSNHRTDDNTDNVNVRTEQDFQAPFQASVKIDSPSQGWSVIKRNDSKSKNKEEGETTTVSSVTTSEFDIENFKPQLEGGFKPIYTFRSEEADTKIDERQE